MFDWMNELHEIVNDGQHYFNTSSKNITPAPRCQLHSEHRGGVRCGCIGMEDVLQGQQQRGDHPANVVQG
ncbi:hypothetical protein SFC43_13830 [Bacteroides sp. CR5/BHMF/2]|nr:hypothetical protein [Bacteroides sp. CR5/BHMF/2]